MIGGCEGVALYEILRRCRPGLRAGTHTPRPLLLQKVSNASAKSRGRGAAMSAIALTLGSRLKAGTTRRLLRAHGTFVLEHDGLELNRFAVSAKH